MDLNKLKQGEKWIEMSWNVENCSFIFPTKKITVLTGEKAQELRTLAAPIEDLSSVPSTLTGQLTVVCNLSPRGPWYHPLLACTGTHTQTHT